MSSSESLQGHPTSSSGGSLAGSSPWLSLLIPAYEYPAGVNRILNSLASESASGVECIIRDDSYSDEVQQVVEAHILRREIADLTYVRSHAPQGAVDNWNELLTMAKGEFVLLMHHDEAPFGQNFFSALRSELCEVAGIDVLILGCLIGEEDGCNLRRHMPASLQSCLLGLMGTEYLLRRNFIGPPSMLVIRRSTCPLFDTRLKWLVDVDWMNRGLKPKSVRSKVSRNLRVASLQRTDASITSTLKGKVRDIERSELEQICTEQRLGSIEHLLQPRNGWSHCLSAMESMLWALVKLWIRLSASLARKRNPFRAARSLP